MCEQSLWATQGNVACDPNEATGILISAESDNRAPLVAQHEEHRMGPALFLEPEATASIQLSAEWSRLPFPSQTVPCFDQVSLSPESSPKPSTPPSPQLGNHEDLGVFLIPFTIQPAK